MNKKTLRIAGWALGLSMAVAGIGAAVGATQKSPIEAKATGSTYTVSSFSGSYSASGGTVTISGVTWTYSSASHLSLNSSKIQVGSKNNPQTSAWTFQTPITSFGEDKKVTSISLTAYTTATTATYSISAGGASVKSGSLATSSSTYTASSLAVTSGNIVFTLTGSSTSKAMYLCGLSVTYESVSAAVTLTGLRVASGDAANKLYEPGDIFDGTGLTVYASWDDVEDTSKNVLSSVVWNGGSALSAGLNQTITGYHASDTGEEYPIEVTGVDVKNADALLNGGDNKPAGVSSSTNEDTGEGQVASSGVKYGYYAFQTYSGNLEFNKNISGAYIGNNESYGKYIRRIVVTLSADNFSKLTMYEGTSAIPGSSSVTGSGTGVTRTFDFDEGMEYFALKQTTTNTWVQIVSIKVFLGDAVVEGIATGVEIATPDSVYVGKTLQLSATVSYSNKSDDHRVTWAVTSGDGATVSDTGLVTAVAATATTITATSISDDDGGEKVTDSVTITPLANPISSVAFDTSGAKTEYVVGESLDISGIAATGTRASGDSEPIELTASNFSGFNSSSPTASQTITITYGDFSTTYTVSIVNKVTLTSDAIGSFGYGDTKTTELAVSINASLASSVSIETFCLYKNSGMQMNPSKGDGYFKNITALPGRITKLVMTWNASGKNSPTVYFGASYIDSKPASGGTTVVNNVTTHTVVPASDSYYFFIDTSTTTGACVMTSLQVFYDQNSVGNAKNFADRFLHMNDYDRGLHVGEDGSNYCLTDGVGAGKGFFATAASAYALLGDGDRTEFKKMSNAVARFNAWASANGKTIDLDTGDVSPVNLVLSGFTTSVDISLPLTMAVIAGTMVAAGGFYLIQRKRRSED